jgi:TFIIF-interacting CTD phosphatase-like protein
MMPEKVAVQLSKPKKQKKALSHWIAESLHISTTTNSTMQETLLALHLL